MGAIPAVIGDAYGDRSLTRDAADETLSNASGRAADAAVEEQLLVDVAGYEGPLHLLLELARKQKVDLIHVSILELAEQYLEFILDAKSKRIDLAADYLLMASWLAWLKSKLLLPKQEPQGVSEESDGDDAARRLAFRLKRLEALRDAGKTLQQGDVLGRDVFRRGAPEQARVITKARYDASLYDLMKAFGDIAVRKSKTRRHVVRRLPVFSLDDARKSLKKMTPELEDWTSVQSIERPANEPEDTPRRSVLASYLSAALELTRDREVEVRQDLPMSDVYVRKAAPEPPAQAAE